jgi:hypothetical protein
MTWAGKLLFFVEIHDAAKEKQIPPLRCGMTTKKADRQQNYLL